MPSLADGLPPEIAALVHPDWRANERAYWAIRDTLLTDYGGQWVAFADGTVVAAGRRPVEVLHAAAAAHPHAFVTLVGAEDEGIRMRRAAFPYHAGYQGEPLPVLSAEFRTTSGGTGVLFDQVIPDTGADATALPLADCRALGLDFLTGTPGRVYGVGGGSTIVLVFAVWVWLDGQEYPCQLQADVAGHERILGRDVLNRMDVLFRGPAGEVVVNP
jgi:hypothetical protein